MSNKQASWADLGGFCKGVETTETTFSEPVGGGFFDIGEHKDVIIEGVEPGTSKAGKPMLILHIVSEDDKKIRKYVMLRGTDKKGNEQFHFVYRQLSAALCNDPERRLAFFGEHLQKNPADFASLVSMRLSILVKQGNSGYTIVENEMGMKIIWDVALEKQWEGTAVYDDYTSAKEAAEKLSLQRSYPEIDRLKPPSEEHALKNIDVIDNILNPKKKKTGKSIKESVKEKAQEVISLDDLDF